MKRFALALVITGLSVGNPWAQGQGRSPFVDHSDTGETIHVLPPQAAIHSPHDTQPTFAPLLDKTAVYAASYGSGNLTNHGGPIISDAGFFAIYWNSAVANSNRTSLGYTAISKQLTAFVNSFPNNSNYSGSATDDYEIVQQYGSGVAIANTLTNSGLLIDNRKTQKSISDSSVRSYLVGLFDSGRVIPNGNTIYGIYFPPGMKVSLQGGGSCTSFCGYHGYFSYGGVPIKYASFPYLDCRACSLSGLTVADMLTIVTSHEIREAVTDPQLNAWYDSVGYEADDKCAWHNLYKMTNGGFWVQPEYSNGGVSGGTSYPGPGCVVPNR